MGRICPILNHPLKDGVLINDEVLVAFIQKRNLDFLPNELVCRSCKREVTKLYNKKLKKAIELHKSRFHDGSISSHRTSKTSLTSTTSEHSVTHNESQQNVDIQRVVQTGGIVNHSSTSVLQRNGSTTNSIVQNNHSNKNSNTLDKTQTSANIVSISQTAAIRVSTITSNNNSILQENLNNQENLEKTIPVENGKSSNVTVRRRRTIKDYLQTANASKTPQIATDDGEDVIRRLSQQPTTSNASVVVASKTTDNSNKRPISAVIDDSDDDESLSLNAVNGTCLPNIQPIPPKRKPVADRAISMARDIMDEYIKDITGG